MASQQHADGEYYEARGTELNPFQVLCLPEDDFQLTVRGVRHHRRVVMPHVFERQNGTARTRGFMVPKWSHVNRAIDELLADLKAARTKWGGQRARWTWNPLAEPGSQAALAPTFRTVLPPAYHAPDIEEVVDESAAQPQPESSTSSGAFWDPVDISSSDDGDPFFQRRRRTPPPFASSRRQPPPPPSPPFASSRRQPPPPPSPPPPSSRRPFRPSPTPPNPFSTTPPTPPSHWLPNSNPASASKRRQRPLGVYLGTWKFSGNTASGRNAVYGSRDRKNRINRRISKEDDHGNVVRGGKFDTKKTACRHEQIDYIERYRGMTREQVDAAIKPLLEGPLPPPQFGRRRRTAGARTAGARTTGAGTAGAGTAGATSSPPAPATASSALPISGGGLTPSGSDIEMISSDEGEGEGGYGSTFGGVGSGYEGTNLGGDDEEWV